MKKILVALGGNALGNTPSEQKQATQNVAKSIVQLAKDGWIIVICHGNGPQVGMINDSFVVAEREKVISEMMPFPECGAMSQGYIGFHLQNAIQNEFNKNKLNTNVITVVTRTVVDKNDKGFSNPSKPIGPFLTKENAQALSKKYGYVVVEDAGRGYRRVIASPAPLKILESPVIKKLVEDEFVVIAGGGGGIPVIEIEPGVMQGIDAVVDKDYTSAKLAELIDVDAFLILTAVENVAINFNKPNQENLTSVSVEQLKKYIEENQFAKGSMLPKINAAISFVKSTNKPAYIGLLQKASEIMSEQSGTKIILGK